MLVDTGVLLGMRCPNCGKLELVTLSRFSVARKNALKVHCACGFLLMTISTKFFKSYCLEVACPICQVSHRQTLPGSQLWAGHLLKFYCPESGVGLGCLGLTHNVSNVVSSGGEKNSFQSMTSGYYFHNRGIMLEALRRLQNISESRQLYCQCGNRYIEVEIFPDRLELNCKNCDSVNIIYAETEEDLQVIKQVEKIELVISGFGYIDSLASVGRIKKSGSKHNNKNN